MSKDRGKKVIPRLLKASCTKFLLNQHTHSQARVPSSPLFALFPPFFKQTFFTRRRCQGSAPHTAKTQPAADSTNPLQASISPFWAPFQACC